MSIVVGQPVGRISSVLVGRHAALGQEGTVEGALVAVAALVGDLGDGVVRVAQQRAGAVDAQCVDVLAEVDVQLLGENMAEVNSADAQGLSHIFQILIHYSPKISSIRKGLLYFIQ